MVNSDGRKFKQGDESGKRQNDGTFRSLFLGHGGGGGGVDDGGNYGPDSEEIINKSGKKLWGFNGLTKWKRDETEDETPPLALHERCDSEAFWGSSKFNSDCNESNWEGSQH